MGMGDRTDKKKRYITYKAPWVLCSLEVLAVMLLYFLGTSRSAVVHDTPVKYHFSYTHSLEDIVGLSCTRAALLSIAYAAGMRHMHRPYLYASYLLAAACFPYIIVKTILYRYSQDAVSAAFIFGLTGAFCWFHVFAARRTVEWARRRYQMGLAGFGYPWEEGEEAWSLLRRPDLEEMTKTSDGGGPDGDDVPAEMMADDDSKFVTVCGIKVHYKEVLPASGYHANEHVGVVLIHGFGGGVFAWRHIMEPLAMQCQCRVIAFDRPAFGLTSRPPVNHDLGDINPYTLGAQAETTLQLCAALGLKYVVLVAHADGCLLAMRAASLAASCPNGFAQQASVLSSMSPALKPRLAVSSADSTPRLFSLSSIGTPHPAAAGIPLPSQQNDLEVLLTPATCGSGGDSGGSNNSVSSGKGPSDALIDTSVIEGMAGKVGLQQPPGLPQPRRSSHDSLLLYSTPGKSGAKLVSPGHIPSAADVTQHHAIDCAVVVGTNPSLCQHSPEGAHHRRSQSMPGPISNGLYRSSASAMVMPQVLGLALLHPNLSGQMGPTLSRLLARSKLGRSILRPLLRTEIGEVANRRAWHNTDKLTPEVLELYKAPLRVEGWDTALMETTRLKREQTQGDLYSYLGNIRQLPSLLVTGEHDRIIPSTKAELLAAELPHSRVAVLSDCGHLSHEEAPQALLAQLVPFLSYVFGDQH